MTAIGIEIVGLMMLIRWSLFPSQKASTDDGAHRVIAMYRYQRAAIVLAVFLLLAWIVVTGWLLSHGGRMFSPLSRCAWIYDKAPSHYPHRQRSLWDYSFSHTMTLFTFLQLVLWCSIRMSLYTTDVHMWVLKHLPAAVLLGFRPRLQLGCLSSTTRISLVWRWTARFLWSAIKKRVMLFVLSLQTDYCITGAQVRFSV